MVELVGFVQVDERVERVEAVSLVESLNLPKAVVPHLDNYLKSMKKPSQIVQKGPPEWSPRPSGHRAPPDGVLDGSWDGLGELLGGSWRAWRPPMGRLFFFGGRLGRPLGPFRRLPGSFGHPTRPFLGAPGRLLGHFGAFKCDLAVKSKI